MTMTTQTPMPTTTPAQTALMPLDPTVSPQQSLRVLPIRADLLPEEITAGRNARRTRILLAGVLVLTAAVLAGWYLYAVQDRDAAGQDLTAVTEQVNNTRRETQKKEYTTVTTTIEKRDTITKQLNSAMSNDLPWYTLLDQLRKTGVPTVKVIDVSGSLDKSPAGATPAAGATKTVGTVTVSGTARDKKTIADYIDALAEADLVTNVYLTAAAKQEKAWTFTLTGDVPASALCGRFTTACKSGGK